MNGRLELTKAFSYSRDRNEQDCEEAQKTVSPIDAQIDKEAVGS